MVSSGRSYGMMQEVPQGPMGPGEAAGAPWAPAKPLGPHGPGRSLAEGRRGRGAGRDMRKGLAEGIRGRGAGKGRADGSGERPGKVNPPGFIYANQN